MATIEQFEDHLKPFKLALVEAFGLDPDKVLREVSVSPDSVTFRIFGTHVIGDLPIGAKLSGILDGEGPHPTTVECSAELWSEGQRRAAEEYMAQFPLRFKLAPVDAGQAREALRAVRASRQLMVIPTGSDIEWQPVPPPTWRDVIRAMRTAGYKLKVEEHEGRYRKWWVDEGTGGIIAEIWRQTLGGRYTWDVQLNCYGLMTHLSDPEPADVLAAGMLTGLIEGPVCGVQVTGISGFPRNQQKHEIR